MKKIKQFFKDVIGEIREPSEDAGKVLGVIKRVLCLILILWTVLEVFGLVQHIVFNYRHAMIGKTITEMINYGGFRFFIVPVIERVINTAIYVCLLILGVKSIRKNQDVKAVFFVIVLAIMILETLVFDIIGGRSFGKILVSLIEACCIVGIFYFSFHRFKEDKAFEANSEGTTRVRNTALLGYTQFIILSIPIIINLFYFASNMKEQLAQYREIYAEFGVLGLISFYSNIVYYIMTLIVVIILILTFISRKLNTNKLRISINILLIIYILCISVFFIPLGILSSSIWFLIIFIIATGYQNKYKVFDNIGTRTLKKVIEKIKAGLDNYLSVGK